MQWRWTVNSWTDISRFVISNLRRRRRLQEKSLSGFCWMQWQHCLETPQFGIRRSCNFYLVFVSCFLIHHNFLRIEKDSRCWRSTSKYPKRKIMKFILHNTTEFTVSTLQTNFSSSTICSGESFADVDFSHSRTSIVQFWSFIIKRSMYIINM